MSVVLYEDEHHKCVAFNDLVAESGGGSDIVPANQFLIVSNDHAALIDPGGNLIYNRLFMGVSEHIFVKNLDYVIASHQDPDIVASLNKWLVGTKCKVMVPEIWTGFVPHFCSPGNTEGRLLGIPDEGMNIDIGGTPFKALPAHFLHSEGNFHFYDPISKILFSGDVGAAEIPGSDAVHPVEDFDAHIKKMEGFHRRYMNSNKVIKLWVNMVRELDIEWIVPQHGGSFKGKKMVNRFLDWFEQLECGIDLVDQSNYRVP